jgi:hypothetical protein
MSTLIATRMAAQPGELARSLNTAWSFPPGRSTGAPRASLWTTKTESATTAAWPTCARRLRAGARPRALARGRLAQVVQAVVVPDSVFVVDGEALAVPAGIQAVHQAVDTLHALMSCGCAANRLAFVFLVSRAARHRPHLVSALGHDQAKLGLHSTVFAVGEHTDVTGSVQTATPLAACAKRAWCFPMADECIALRSTS